MDSAYDIYICQQVEDMKARCSALERAVDMMRGIYGQHEMDHDRLREVSGLLESCGLEGFGER